MMLMDERMSDRSSMSNLNMFLFKKKRKTFELSFFLKMLNGFPDSGNLYICLFSFRMDESEFTIQINDFSFGNICCSFFEYYFFRDV